MWKRHSHSTAWQRPGLEPNHVAAVICPPVARQAEGAHEPCARPKPRYNRRHAPLASTSDLNGSANPVVSG